MYFLRAFIVSRYTQSAIKLNVTVILVEFVLSLRLIAVVSSTKANIAWYMFILPWECILDGPPTVGVEAKCNGKMTPVCPYLTAVCRSLTVHKVVVMACFTLLC